MIIMSILWCVATSAKNLREVPGEIWVDMSFI